MREMTAPPSAFRQEERVGLIVAVVLHALVIAAMLIQPFRSDPPPLPERMTVSLASEVSLESTAPAPVPESRAAIAPELSDTVAPPVDEADTPQASEPDTQPPARSNNQPRAQSPPQPASTPSARPTRGGGSRIGDNFLGGQGNSTRTDETRIPASEIGRSARASLQQALSRQVRPHWNAPQGVDIDLLITLLDFDLNEDGSLKGRPRVRSQQGINDSNRPQASLHAERAIRAVQLAAPFDLPDEYYNAWKSIRGARFDRNLSR